jgi:hypothetical protein
MTDDDLPDALLQFGADCDSAMARDTVPLELVMEARLRLHKAEEGEVEFCRLKYEELLAHLASAGAPVSRVVVYPESGLGAVLLDGRGFRFQLTRIDAVNSVLIEIEHLASEAFRNLPDNHPDRHTIANHLFDIITSVLEYAERLASGEPETPEVLDLHARELEGVRRYYERAAGRVALLRYLEGMALGVPAVVALAVVLGLLLWWHDSPDLDGDAIVISLIAGGFGAVISVMTRLTAGRLRLDFEAGNAQLRTLGAIRPLIGAIFGIALYFVVESGLVSLRVGDDDPRLHFFVAVAFVAGFSERWAQDMLGVAQRGGKDSL